MSVDWPFILHLPSDLDPGPWSDVALKLQTIIAPESENYNHLGDRIWVAGRDPDELYMKCIVDERTTVEKGTKYLVKYKHYTVNSTTDWWRKGKFFKYGGRIEQILKDWENREQRC